MATREEGRERTTGLMADHLLRHGLAGARLKSLAAAAGASDRMLLYYFADRDDLLTATLAHLAARLAATLDRALPQRLDFGALQDAVWTTVSAPELRPYMHLWLELAAEAARGRQPYRTVAGEIADGFLAWVEGRLDAPEEDRPSLAARLLALTEGRVLLDALGRPAIAEDAGRAAKPPPASAPPARS